MNREVPMAFATDSERFALIQDSVSFGLPFVVRIRKGERESELTADDFEHAYDLAMSWKHTHGAEYVEILRVCEHDGSLYGGIGAL
jgi:hypothetical protein